LHRRRARQAEREAQGKREAQLARLERSAQPAPAGWRNI
jgi:hypothetical protein